MALELIGGAVLGAAVGELLKAVMVAKETDANFQQALTRLECTLKSVTPRVKEIIELNKKLNIPDDEMKELIAMLQNGKEVVHRCSEISYINLVRKHQHYKLLLELDYSLLRYFQTILLLDHVRDNKEVLVMVRELHEGLVGVKEEDTVKQATDTRGENVKLSSYLLKLMAVFCFVHFSSRYSAWVCFYFELLTALQLFVMLLESEEKEKRALESEGKKKGRLLESEKKEEKVLESE